jgi:hypothetical protein
MKLGGKETKYTGKIMFFDQIKAQNDSGFSFSKF